MAIFAFIIVCLVIYGINKLLKSADIPWVTAKSKRYRIYKVHGNHRRPWVYKLQKRYFFYWDIVSDEYSANKNDDRYNEWIEKYKMEKQHNYWN